MHVKKTAALGHLCCSFHWKCIIHVLFFHGACKQSANTMCLLWEWKSRCILHGVLFVPNRNPVVFSGFSQHKWEHLDKKKCRDIFSVQRPAVWIEQLHLQASLEVRYYSSRGCDSESKVCIHLGDPLSDYTVRLSVLTTGLTTWRANAHLFLVAVNYIVSHISVLTSAPTHYKINSCTSISCWRSYGLPVAGCQCGLETFIFIYHTCASTRWQSY